MQMVLQTLFYLIVPQILWNKQDIIMMMMSVLK